MCDCVGISSIVIYFQAKGKMNKERVSHLKDRKVTVEKCGQVSPAKRVRDGMPLTVILYFYFHKRIRTPFRSWTSSYKGLETLLAERRLNLDLCGFSQKCKTFVFCSILFRLHFVWKPDVGRKDLVHLTDFRSVNLCVFRKAPAKAIKPWIKNDVYLKSAPMWDCLMLRCGRALGEQPDQEMLHLQPSFISNVAIHQCKNWSCWNY